MVVLRECFNTGLLCGSGAAPSIHGWATRQHLKQAANGQLWLLSTGMDQSGSEREIQAAWRRSNGRGMFGVKFTVPSHTGYPRGHV